MRVQICDPAQKAIPGYTFDDCRPLQGDEVAAPVRWKRKRDLAALVGRPLRLEVRLYDARLYALRVDGAWWYTNTPQPVAGIA